MIPLGRINWTLEPTFNVTFHFMLPCFNAVSNDRRNNGMLKGRF